MESNTLISLEVSSTDRKDKAIKSNVVSKQTELISTQQSSAEITKQNASDKNEQSIDKANALHVYENSTHIADEISESDLSKLTQSESINPQTVAEEASYIQMDNYISFNYKLDESETSTTISIKPSNAGITEQAKTKSTNLSGSNAGIIEQNRNQFTENAPTIQERIIDMNDLVNLPSIYEDIMNNAEPDDVSTISIYEYIIDKDKPDGMSNYNNDTEIHIYENMIDKAKPDGVYTHDNKTQISSNDKLHKTSLSKSTNTNKKMNKVQPRIMTNKCKLVFAILVGLVITVPVISLIIWGVNSRDKVNKNAEPVINITTIDLTECLDNSVNYSEYCKDSIVKQLTDINTTSKNISLLTRQETTTSSGQNDTYHGYRERTASIDLTAWATSMVKYEVGTTLIFNGIDEENNDFDRSTGLFTCPITGIYYVYVTLRKYNIDNLYVDVFKMNSRIIRFSENYTGSPWNTVSNSALVSCSLGEIIQMKGWSSGSIYGEANVRCSSFSVIKVDQKTGNSPDETFVGYSGYANPQSLSDGDPINFPNPLCNVGKHFSRNRFTCPYTGIYFVSVTYWKYPSTSESYSVDAHVYRGDTKVLYLYHHVSHYNYVTNNALVRCNRGEHIETKAGGTTYQFRSYLFGSGSYPESIFTVMSVHQEDQLRPLIGFSRYKTDQQDYSAGEVLTFTGIIMDEENYFQSNQFVCPVDGSYYFLLNLWKSNFNKIEVDLKHADQIAFKLEDSSSNWNIISNSAVIRCLKGDVVHVVSARRGSMYGSSDRITTFTGFLLYKN